jgi:hypothetical protein
VRRARECAPYLRAVRLPAKLTVEQRIADRYPGVVKTDTGDLTRRLASSFEQIASQAEPHLESLEIGDVKING